jgi:hypothetical protein
MWRDEQGFPLSDESFHDSLLKVLLKAVERGILSEYEPTGEPLTDALRRRDLERAIRRGQFGGATTDGSAEEN